MKQHFLLGLGLCVATLLMSSCSSVYHYVQVLQVQPTQTTTDTYRPTNDEVCRYENNECVISYDFGKDGEAGFTFYNKTEQIIYIDLSKSFLIVNGVARDYYENKTSNYAASTTSGVSSVFNFFNKKSTSTIASTNAASTSVSTSVVSAAIIAIPPKSSKHIRQETIIEGPLLLCDIDRYPSHSSSIDFSEESSPISFANYLTYGFEADENQKHIEHSFYVSKVSNYTEPAIITYVPRDAQCDNVLLPIQRKSNKNRYNQSPQVYDQYILHEDNSLYVTYQVESMQQLYKKDNTMWWSDAEQGWITF